MSSVSTAKNNTKKVTRKFEPPPGYKPPNKHIQFEGEEGEGGEGEGEEEGGEGEADGTQVLRTGVYLRMPMEKKTVEKWQSTGWRKYRDYSGNNNNNNTKKKRKSTRKDSACKNLFSLFRK